jgi:hypothetical protein
MQLLKYTVAFFILFNLVYARVIGGREFEEMSRVIRNRNSSLGREITDPSVDLVQSWQKLYETNMGRKNGQKPNMARAKLPYPRNYLFN